MRPKDQKYEGNVKFGTDKRDKGEKRVGLRHQIVCLGRNIIKYECLGRNIIKCAVHLTPLHFPPIRIVHKGCRSGCIYGCSFDYICIEGGREREREREGGRERERERECMCVRKRVCEIYVYREKEGEKKKKKKKNGQKELRGESSVLVIYDKS